MANFMRFDFDRGVWTNSTDGGQTFSDAANGLLKGTLANRPAAGLGRRFYFATDTAGLFYDNGTVWIPIGGGGYVIDVDTTQVDFQEGTLTDVEADAGGYLRLAGVVTVELEPIADAPIQEIGSRLADTSAINYGANPTFEQNYYCDYSNGSPVLYKFDLSSLPSDALIEDAYFKAYYWDEDSDTTEDLTRTCRAITSDWIESSVTWNTRPTWDNTNRGTIHQPTNGASGYYDSGSGSLTQLVKDWFDGVLPNYGLATVRTSCTTMGAGSEWRISTNLREAASNRPKLVVTYRKPFSGPRVGTRVSPRLNLSQVGVVKSSSISWTQTLNGGTITIETRVSTDIGESWTDWKTCTNGGPIPDLPTNTDVHHGMLECRQKLSTSDPTVTPQLEELTVKVVG